MAATETLETVIHTAKAVKEMVIEECAQIAESHKSCGCSCSERIPRQIAAEIRKQKSE